MLSVDWLQPAIRSTPQQSLRNTSCCLLKPCTLLRGAAFRPSTAAQFKGTESSCRKRVRSHVLTRLQATADQQTQQEVFEYITLFKVKDGVDADTTESMLDKYWSLQYMIPAGVLNGFAGPVEVMHAADSRLCMTHAVHFRFGSMQHIDNFRRHEKLQQVREEAAHDVFDSIHEMVLAGKVPRDLEAIFRKGSDWDLGVDHILILQAQEDATDQEMQKFLQVLAELSNSPAIDAMQTTHGPLRALSGSALGSHVVFTRLSLQGQLDVLVASPPHLALTRKDPRLPAKAVASYAMSIAPAQKQKSRSPDGQGVLGVSTA